jgi:hypothetical protein
MKFIKITITIAVVFSLILSKNLNRKSKIDVLSGTDHYGMLKVIDMNNESDQSDLDENKIEGKFVLSKSVGKGGTAKVFKAKPYSGLETDYSKVDEVKNVFKIPYNNY